MTLDELLDKIYNNKSARIKEILLCRLKIQENEDFGRIFFPILCAHFEGFIRECANYYIEYVSSKSVQFYKLKTNFKAIYLRSEFESIKHTVSDHSRLDFIDGILNLETEIFYVKSSGNKPVITTEGNPKPDTLECILKSLGINSSIFNTKEHFINNRLLAIRHAVVHGQLRPVDCNTFNETSLIVMELINSFADLIFDSAEQELYLLESDGS